MGVGIDLGSSHGGLRGGCSVDEMGAGAAWVAANAASNSRLMSSRSSAMALARRPPRPTAIPAERDGHGVRQVIRSGWGDLLGKARGLAGKDGVGQARRTGPAAVSSPGITQRPNWWVCRGKPRSW